MEHVLVIGGSGMLAKVAIYLVEKDYHVSVVGRNYEKMQMIINESTNQSKFSAVSSITVIAHYLQGRYKSKLRSTDLFVM